MPKKHSKAEATDPFSLERTDQQLLCFIFSFYPFPAQMLSVVHTLLKNR